MERQTLASWMAARGFDSNKALADAAGVHKTDVSRWLTGRRPVYLNAKRKLAAALGIKVEQIIFPVVIGRMALPTRAQLLAAAQVQTAKRYADACVDHAAALGYQVNPNADEGGREEEETRRMLELNEAGVNEAAFERALEIRLRNENFVRELAQRLRSLERAS